MLKASLIETKFYRQVSLIFFLVGNAFCTGAQNLPMLLAGRGIAGVGCAGLIAVRLSNIPPL
jgi:predicted MFS family arabinose efflux permease